VAFAAGHASQGSSPSSHPQLPELAVPAPIRAGGSRRGEDAALRASINAGRPSEGRERFDGRTTWRYSTCWRANPRRRLQEPVRR
jgi:hypothetical protein